MKRMDILNAMIFGTGSGTPEPTPEPTPTGLSIDDFLSNTNIGALESDAATITEYGAKAKTSITSVKMNSLTEIPNYAFTDCSGMGTAQFDHAQAIGKYAFQRCTALTSLTVPMLQKIGNYSFSRCSQLASIDISNLQEIGDNCFEHCSALTNETWPSLSKIGTSAFSTCLGLVTFRAPAKSIGSTAFQASSNLERVILTGDTVCSLYNYNAFNGTKARDTSTANGGIFVPDELYDSYITANNWAVLHNTYGIMHKISELPEEYR